MRFLVAYERPVRGVGAVDAGFPARLPEHFVSAPEGEIDAGGTRSLDVGALWPGPVLVVAHRQKDLVLFELGRAGAIRVDAGRIADVEAVGFEVPDRRVLGVEHPVLGAGAARCNRAVVAHFVRAPRTDARAADVQAVAAVRVVRLPRGVRRLEQDIGLRLIVANDEDDMALAACIDARQPGDVHARDGRRGDVPRCGLGPVAAVDETG